MPPYLPRAPGRRLLLNGPAGGPALARTPVSIGPAGTVSAHFRDETPPGCVLGAFAVFARDHPGQTRQRLLGRAARGGVKDDQELSLGAGDRQPLSLQLQRAP